MTRAELDGRFDQNIVRENPWEMVCDKWNDPNYLLDDFSSRIDLGHSEVEGMGTLTLDKAKKKFYKLKNELVIVKMKWSASGNGNGSCLQEKAIEYNSDGEEKDQEEMDIINGSDLKCFIGGMSPSILYFWKKGRDKFCFHCLSTAGRRKFPRYG